MRWEQSKVSSSAYCHIRLGWGGGHEVCGAAFQHALAFIPCGAPVRVQTGVSSLGETAEVSTKLSVNGFTLEPGGEADNTATDWGLGLGG